MSEQLVSNRVSGVGLGLRSTHIAQILTEFPQVAWFEVLLDNHTARGGLIRSQLAAVRSHYPISFHCVGMSLAGVNPLCWDYLSTVKAMIEQYQPVSVSDHLCFTRFGKHHFNDLLPFPYTQESLNHIAERVNRVQEYLGVRLLIENLSMYFLYNSSEMAEAEFIAQLVAKTGCAILLDLNNIYVNEVNHGISAKQYIDTLPLRDVEEVHVAGHESKGDYLIDAHNSTVSDPVWDLLSYFYVCGGDAPVLIEWDNDIPQFDVLLEQAQQASFILHDSQSSTTTLCQH